MKRTILFLTIFMIAAVTFTGCKKDDETPVSYMLVGEDKYIISGGDLFFEGANGMEANLYNFSISLVSEGLTYSSFNRPNPSYTGNGLLTLFHLHTTGATELSDGDYPLDILTGQRCSGGGFEVNFSTAWSNVKEFDTGNLTVHVDGDTYTVEYNGVDEYGTTIELFFTGRLTYHDEHNF